MALTEETGLVGHDGWADGRLGDYARSEVLLNDYLLIEEVSGLDKEERLERLHALGDEAAAHFRALLPEALERFRRLIVLTHVPPFREACWHRGQISDDEWLPHFSCRAVGEVLVEAMAAHPGVRDDGALRPHPFPGRGPDPPEPARPDRRRRVRQAATPAGAGGRMSCCLAAPGSVKPAAHPVERRPGQAAREIVGAVGGSGRPSRRQEAATASGSRNCMPILSIWARDLLDFGYQRRSRGWFDGPVAGESSVLEPMRAMTIAVWFFHAPCGTSIELISTTWGNT